MLNKKLAVLLIDPQVDFCEQSGSLYVRGAEQAMENAASLIKKGISNWTQLYITQDSHDYYNISHPLYWIDESGRHPNAQSLYEGKPVSIIPDDVREGRWVPTLSMELIPELNKTVYDYSLSYLDYLYSKGRYSHTIWPYHCINGTIGQSMVPNICEVVAEFSEKRVKVANIINKGKNPYTEHFSAFKAVEPFPNDVSTRIDSSLIESLAANDFILVMGVASSHCVAESVRDLVEEFSKVEDKNLVSRIVLIEDAMCPVAGFEELEASFFKDMKGRGVKTAKSKDF